MSFLKVNEGYINLSQLVSMHLIAEKGRTKERYGRLRMSDGTEVDISHAAWNQIIKLIK